MMRAGARGTVTGVLLLLATIAAIYWTLFGASFNQSVGPWALVRAAPEFALGCLLCRLVHHVDMRNLPWFAIVAAFAALWVASFWTVLPIGLFAIPLFVVLILACSAQQNLEGYVRSPVRRLRRREWRPHISRIERSRWPSTRRQAWAKQSTELFFSRQTPPQSGL